MKEVRRSTWFKLAAFLVVVSAFFYVVPYGAIFEWFTFEHVVEWVKSAQSNTWTLLIFFAAFSFGVLAFPITIFPIVGGVLFPFWIAFPVNLAASTLGATMAYGIARFFGREAVEGFLKGKFKAFDSMAEHKGIKTVALLRWIGVPPFLVANYALGLSGIHPRDYFIGTVVGIAPWMALITYLASSLWTAALVGGEKGLMAAVFVKMGPLMILSALVLIGVIVNFYLKRRKEKAHSNL